MKHLKEIRQERVQVIEDALRGVLLGPTSGGNALRMARLAAPTVALWVDWAISDAHEHGGDIEEARAAAWDEIATAIRLRAET